MVWNSSGVAVQASGVYVARVMTLFLVGVRGNRSLQMLVLDGFIALSSSTCANLGSEVVAALEDEPRMSRSRCIHDTET